MIIPDNEKYGIVIDSGSSGSRIQIYKWEDQKHSKDNPQNEQALNSPPVITQQEDWTFKISPGISTYENKVKDLWDNHFHGLLEYAENIIPKEKHKDTPVFVLATAGMRLLPPNKQRAILKETCSVLRSKTDFYMPNCHDFVQVIDGETEGLYGWIGLNYLMGQFDNVNKNDEIRESIGFMDMGGASTQIAFVPSSKEEITKHDEDLSTVTLRSINGETQTWRVFVETWLGFGANEARRRYLNQLVNSYTSNHNKVHEISDPCLPREAKLDYKYEGSTYTVVGMGDYQQCVKSIYPILLKNIPCKDTPCFFNGIHGPKLDFNKDKFIGISEYWYTANDIFQSGGEYNYHLFNEKVKEFCESDWPTILKNSEEGKYSKLDPDMFLKSACFKASWVMNVLHEGFELPRLSMDDIPKDGNGDEEKALLDKHVPFKSANSVNEHELSWTLGKMLLFASSQITPSNEQDPSIGIYPSDISGQDFVPGGGSTRLLAVDVSDDEYATYDRNETRSSIPWIPIFLILFILLAWWIQKSNRFFFGSKVKRVISYIPVQVRERLSNIPILRHVSGYAQVRESAGYDLEEGISSPFKENNDITNNNVNTPESENNDQLSYYQVLRTRSTANLSSHEGSPETDNFEAGGSNIANGGRYTPNFINKPFTVPKRGQGGLFQFQDHNSSRESLARSSSATSIKKAKGFD